MLGAAESKAKQGKIKHAKHSKCLSTDSKSVSSSIRRHRGRCRLEKFHSPLICSLLAVALYTLSCHFLVYTPQIVLDRSCSTTITGQRGSRNQNCQFQLLLDETVTSNGACICLPSSFGSLDPGYFQHPTASVQLPWTSQ